MIYSLHNRVALITGASRGLGKQIAKQFWRAGANLVVVARDQSALVELRDKLLAEAHENRFIQILSTDLAKPESVAELIEHLNRQAIKIDILVNNAATQGPIGKAWENNWDEWQETIQVDLLSPVALCRAFVPAMIAQDFGKIINISGGGASNSRPNFSAYAVAKTGLIRFSETLADELKTSNISVNCIAPGVMQTQILQNILDAGPDAVGHNEYAKLTKSAAADSAILQAAELCTYLAASTKSRLSGKLISAVWDNWKSFEAHLADLENTDIYTLRRIIPSDRGKNWDNKPNIHSLSVSVAGLWHLGSVISTCLANAGHQVLSYDPNPDTIAKLKLNQPPVYEPKLESLLQKCQEAGQLHFTSTLSEIGANKIIWITFDTDVDENDKANTDFVVSEIEKIFAVLSDDALILISSQIPIGTTAILRTRCKQLYPHKNIRFAYIPENLRLGKSVDVFTQTDRFVVGLDDQKDKEIIEQLLNPFTQQIVWMSIESAEMTKHALNAYLATSVVFINELAALCEKTGADAHEVERGLKSEERIGAKAYLRPGSAIAGGTLLRDINYLIQLSKIQSHPIPLISSVLESNSRHKDWVQRKIVELMSTLKNKTIAVLGLTYKVNTNTLRRSSTIETCHWLNEQGVTINAYDPAIEFLPEEYSSFINLKGSIADSLTSADAIIIATEWPTFKNIFSETILETNAQPIVLDPNGFLMSTLGKDSRISYYSVGRTL